MLKNQQTQIGSLVKDRNLLEDRIKLQYDIWVSDFNLFQDQITQMKRDFTVQEMERMVEGAKSDLVMGLKQKEAFVYKKKFEDADDDLSDFRDCFECLSHQYSSEQDASTSANGGELMRLKCENEKLRTEKDSDVSALLSEKKFVWNQLNEMEKDLNKQLKARKDEVKSLNGMIEKLLSRMEELESSNTVKDATIATLKADMAKLESEPRKKDDKISRFSKEIEMLKSKNETGTPILKPCTRASSRLNEKGHRSSKRKGVDIINISEETPKLFTSAFKVPKLRSSSSPAPN